MERTAHGKRNRHYIGDQRLVDLYMFCKVIFMCLVFGFVTHSERWFFSSFFGYSVIRATAFVFVSANVHVGNNSRRA